MFQVSKVYDHYYYSCYHFLSQLKLFSSVSANSEQSSHLMHFLWKKQREGKCGEDRTRASGDILNNKKEFSFFTFFTLLHHRLFTTITIIIIIINIQVVISMAVALEMLCLVGRLA